MGPMVSLAPHRRPLLLLWGFMGTGKSSVAKLLAATLARPVLDLDALIVAREGCSIPVLFDTRGEAGFRAAERAAMTEVLAREDVCVVALGGGTLVDADVRHRALRHHRPAHGRIGPPAPGRDG